ncbi:MAG TPA: hypothetical protein VJL78_06285 [Candidatus Nitrosocosmicus sp.]|nr:hypothetical protein [Candidatus Nitrosocosmicus sp.]
MSNTSIKKSVGLSILAVLLAISISIIPTNISYAYVEFNVSGSESGEDRSITSSQSSMQGSYCYAPPNATIIDSCNSGDLSSSENTGLNIYEQ